MTTSTDLAAYLQSLQREYDTGHAAEHAYRPALKTLLALVDSGWQVVSDPRRIDVGAPDFIMLRGGIPAGYVEAQDIGTDLNVVERDEQMTRYRAALPNLILTNTLEFRWYVSGEPRRNVRVGELRGGKIQRDRDADQLANLLGDFARLVTPTISVSGDLAVRMAGMSRELRDLIIKSLTGDAPGRDLPEQMQAFVETLMPNITPEIFADMFAQTIAYGLLAARVRHKGAGRQQPFTRRDAFWDLPPTNPFLKKLFQQIEGSNLDDRVAWMADALADLLAHADIESVLSGFRQSRRQDDPISHFYETFLSNYDPQVRELRGVYYTPEPVVSYIVRSVDHLLRKRFKRALGLADESTLILDPAVGTGTFLYFAIQHIYDTLRQQHQLGAWDEYVRDHLLPRLFGFEMQMASYAVAHMKLGLRLAGTGYSFASNQRLGVYLTNTLDETAHQSTLPLAHLLMAEAAEAAAIKNQKPIMVVMGNPNTPPDDDAQFIRFGQRRIQQTGSGVVAFVTNNDYLDNPAFGEMRQSLMQTFSDIYIVNLHGEPESAPDGSPDENVFDTQQGVAIGIFVKKQQPHPEGAAARIHYLDLWGSRADKYKWLLEHALAATPWQELSPQTPLYLFIPQDTELLAEYEQGWKVTDIFLVNATGITARDDTKFQSGVSVVYRPFDNRQLDYQPDNADRTVTHSLTKRENLALLALCPPLDEASGSFFVSDRLAEKSILSPLDSAQVFILYEYPDPNELVSDSPFAPGKDGRRPNLNAKLILELARRLGMTFVPDGHGDLKDTFGPQDVFYYAYAVFHSPTYRTRYAEFLQTDFPRLPLTSSKKLFRALAKKGDDLVDLHLMHKAESWPLITGFVGTGDSEVEPEYPKFIELAGEPGGRVYINDRKYFENVERDVWNFQIGAYQVLHRWLQDRQGRALEWQDLRHYQQMVVALRKTLDLMAEINDLIPSWPLV